MLSLIVPRKYYVKKMDVYLELLIELKILQNGVRMYGILCPLKASRTFVMHG